MHVYECACLLCMCVPGIVRRMTERENMMKKHKMRGKEKRSGGLKVTDSEAQTQRPLSLLSPPHRCLTL